MRQGALSTEAARCCKSWGCLCGGGGADIVAVLRMIELDATPPQVPREKVNPFKPENGWHSSVM